MERSRLRRTVQLATVLILLLSLCSPIFNQIVSARTLEVADRQRTIELNAADLVESNAATVDGATSGILPLPSILNPVTQIIPTVLAPVATLAPVIPTVIAPVATLIPTIPPIIPTIPPIVPTLIPTLPPVLADGDQRPGAPDGHQRPGDPDRDQRPGDPDGH